MHGPGAAERHQREAPGVDPALHGDHAQRPDHLLVGDPHDALRRVDRVEVELVRERADGPLGRVDVELDPAGERRRRAEVAEREVGVGHRRLVAAAPVAGGAGLGARGSRADPQRAAGIAPADRSATGADRVHVDHRELDHAAVELARVGLADPARPRPRRRRRRCRPCRSRARCRRPRAGRAVRRRPRPRRARRARSRLLHEPPRRPERPRRRTSSPSARAGRARPRPRPGARGSGRAAA